MCLLMFNLLELHSFGHSILFKLQLIVMAYSIFLLLSMRLNFFMDVTTGLVFGHYMFYFINDRISRIDQCIIAVTRKIFG